MAAFFSSGPTLKEVAEQEAQKALRSVKDILDEKVKQCSQLEVQCHELRKQAAEQAQMALRKEGTHLKEVENLTVEARRLSALNEEM